MEKQALNMGITPGDLIDLKEFFPEDGLEWLPKSIGKSDKGYWALLIPYMNRIAVMDRLDFVCGGENWKDEYETGPSGGVLCKLSIRIDGEWITKCDAAENTDIESIKGGISDALKRAATKWGIGRYLALLPKFYAIISESGKCRAKYKSSSGKVEYFKYDIPPLPEEWLPKHIDTEILTDLKNQIKEVIKGVPADKIDSKQKKWLEAKLKGRMSESEARKALTGLKSLSERIKREAMEPKKVETQEVKKTEEPTESVDAPEEDNPYI